MTNYINKDSKINRFVNRVITPALDAIEIDKDNLPAPASDTGALGGLHRDGSTINDLVSKNTFNIKPNSFDRVSPRGGLVSAADLVDLFQYYAYCLTSIRRANLMTRKLTKGRNRGSIEPKHGSVDRYYRLNDQNPASFTFMDLDKITALSSEYRAGIGGFKWVLKISFGGDPLPALKTGGTNPSAAMNTFIDQLRDTVTYFRNLNPVDVSVCHSACHANCHHARGGAERWKRKSKTSLCL